jgi:hypothetical protein
LVEGGLMFLVTLVLQHITVKAEMKTAQIHAKGYLTRRLQENIQYVEQQDVNINLNK